MQVTYFDWFRFEWAKACCKLNPTDENKKRLHEVVKDLTTRKTKADTDEPKEMEINVEES